MSNTAVSLVRIELNHCLLTTAFHAGSFSLNKTIVCFFFLNTSVSCEELHLGPSFIGPTGKVCKLEK